MTSGSAVFTTKNAQNRQLPCGIFTVSLVAKNRKTACENKRKSAGRADSLAPCNIVEHLVCSTEHNLFKNLITFIKSFKHTQISSAFSLKISHSS